MHRNSSRHCRSLNLPDDVKKCTKKPQKYNKLWQKFKFIQHSKLLLGISILFAEIVVNTYCMDNDGENVSSNGGGIVTIRQIPRIVPIDTRRWNRPRIDGKQFGTPHISFRIFDIKLCTLLAACNPSPRNANV